MSHKDKHKDKKKKREKIKQFLRESKKHLKKIAKRALSDLPPEAQEVIKGAVRTTLDVLSGTFPTCLLPENTQAPITRSLPTPPREYTFQDIDDLIFERIKDIVSHASPDKSFPQGFSNHLLDPNDREKGMLDAKIRGLQYNSVVNLILRIDQELNKNSEWSEIFINENQTTAEAARAIRGLINSLIEIREGKIVQKSQNKEVYNFIVSCSQKKILGIFDRCLLLEHQDDQEYYSMFVGNALDCLREGNKTSWWNGRGDSCSVNG